MKWRSITRCWRDDGARSGIADIDRFLQDNMFDTTISVPPNSQIVLGALFPETDKELHDTHASDDIWVVKAVVQIQDGLEWTHSAFGAFCNKELGRDPTTFAHAQRSESDVPVARRLLVCKRDHCFFLVKGKTPEELASMVTMMKPDGSGMHDDFLS